MVRFPHGGPGPADRLNLPDDGPQDAHEPAGRLPCLCLDLHSQEGHPCGALGMGCPDCNIFSHLGQRCDPRE